MKNEPVSELIEKANTFYAYVGEFGLRRIDHKRRLLIPKDIITTLVLRKKLFGLEKTLLFGFERTQGDACYFSIWDYFPTGNERKYYLKVDSANRILLPKEILITKEKEDLVLLGNRDHLEIYRQKDYINR